jgi:hypothetical protein
MGRSNVVTTITRSEILPLLVEACPSYEPELRRFKSDYVDDVEPFLYVAFPQFTRCLSRVLAAGDVETVQRVFALVERLIVEGDAEVQEAAVVGIIRNLQNANLHEQTSPDDYLPYLMPESQRWWGKVKTFWINGRLLIED